MEELWHDSGASPTLNAGRLVSSLNSEKGREKSLSGRLGDGQNGRYWFFDAH